MKNILVTAPTGGFANHIRWLLLLDKQYQISISYIHDQYDNCKEEHWPTKEYLENNFLTMSSDIRQEIIDRLGQPLILPFEEINDKIKWIGNNVYPQSRTHDNWLEFEWRYREAIDPFIHVGHLIRDVGKYYLMTDYPDELMFNKYDKVVLAVIDPTVAHSVYKRLNPQLNGTPDQEFKDQIEDQNQATIELASTNKEKFKLINSTALYDSKLDYNLYTDIVSFLQLDNNYESAEYIHRLWFERHTS